MPTLETLDIKLNADAQMATKSIDKLAKKLDVLSTSLKRIEGVNLTAFTNSINGISTAVGAMKGVSAKKFTDLASGLTTLSKVKINSAEFANMSIALQQLGTAAQSIGKINSSVVKFVDATARLASAGHNMAIVTSVMPTFTTNLQLLMNTMAQAPVISQETVQFTSALGNLANASVRLGATSGNLSLFGNELLRVMNVLAQAPQINSSTIDMTNALANLATQGNRVSSASSSLVTGITRIGSTARRNTRHITSLAAAFGKFYATYFLVIRAFKQLWKSIKSSMEYIEVANYFNEAFSQVALEADLSAYRELGYASAEEYADSFAERAKDLTQKMTGYEIGEKGSLFATGEASLGMNPAEVMNYQAMFGQMASSMGVASETSLKLSNALTMIGADLASIKNMDFEDTWQTMSSGIVGMSRSWDRYGVNIRNVNLQQKLNELGIQASIDKLNQQDKALLRGIILLENTRYAWADLADTIESPANQLRLLEASAKNFARTFGGLFLGLVSNVMPYLNGLFIALERGIKYLGELIGINWDSVFSAMSGDAGENTVISDILDQADEAQTKVKSLQRQLMGFDEINKLGGADDSATSNMLDDLSGITTAFDNIYEEYTAHWEKQFKKVENNANRIADKIVKMFKPIKKIFDSFSVGNFLQAGEDYSTFVIGLTNFFNNALDNVDWDEVGNKIGDFIKGIKWVEVLKSTGGLIINAIESALKTWQGVFKAAPIETAIITAIGLFAFTPLGGIVMSAITASITTAVGGATAMAGLKAVGMTIANYVIGGVAAAFLGFNIGNYIWEQWTGEKIDMSMGEQIDYLKGAVKTGELHNALMDVGTDIQSVIYGAFTGEALSMTLADQIMYLSKTTPKEIFDAFITLGADLSKSIFEGLFNYDNTTALYKYAGDYFLQVGEAFKKGDWAGIGINIIKGIGTGIAAGLTFLTEPLSDIFTWVFNKICALFGIHSPAKEMYPIGENIVKGIGEGFVYGKQALIQKFKDVWNSIADYFNRKLTLTIPSITIAGQKLTDEVKLQMANIPKFATGGFPEDGLFMANHGELVGKFSNGRTAVANNEQIVEGIEAGVYNAVVAALATASGNNTNVTVVLEGDSAELFRIVQQQGRDYQRMYNREVFA